MPERQEEPVSDKKEEESKAASSSGADGFFDTISNSVFEKKDEPEDFRSIRKTDVDTFGSNTVNNFQLSTNNRGRGRGRGGRGGRGRGNRGRGGGDFNNRQQNNNNQFHRDDNRP